MGKEDGLWPVTEEDGVSEESPLFALKSSPYISEHSENSVNHHSPIRFSLIFTIVETLGYVGGYVSIYSLSIDFGPA